MRVEQDVKKNNVIKLMQLSACNLITKYFKHNTDHKEKHKLSLKFTNSDFCCDPNQPAEDFMKQRAAPEL